MQLMHATAPIALFEEPCDTLAMRLLVSLATYNERDNLAPLIAEIHQFAPHADILVVDDNSPDGTGRLADELAASDVRVHVLHRPGKLGLGTATVAAMRYALAHDYQLLLNLDADFSHHPRYVPAMLALIDRYDIVIGSRYVAGGGTKNWPWRRRLLSRTVNALARLLLRIPARDTSGAFRCYRLCRLRRVPLDKFVSTGYSFQEEVLYRCRQAGMTMTEVPIVFKNRRAGSSKVDFRETMQSLGVLLWLGAESIFGDF